MIRSFTLNTPAERIGIVVDRASGEVTRIMNPDFEEQLDLHPLAPGEFMIRVPKTEYGIGRFRDAMTLADVQRIVSAFGTNSA